MLKLVQRELLCPHSIEIVYTAFRSFLFILTNYSEEVERVMGC